MHFAGKATSLSTFWTEDLAKVQCFLGIEVAKSKNGIVISQRKYAMDILEGIRLMDANC